MRLRLRVRGLGALIIVLFSVVLGPAQAAPTALYSWFARATAWDAPGTSQKIAAPDSFGSPCAFKYDRGTSPSISPFWSLLKYDRKHQIGLATEHNDGHGCAVFNAPTPPATVPDADLSQARTSRGLRIGSTYAQVLAAYGPAAKRGQHFVTSYSAGIRGVTVALPHQTIELPQRITLVIDNGRVSSIVIYVDESGLY